MTPPPLAARVYHAAHRLWARAGRPAEAAHTGAWLGVLSREALHAVDQAFYERSTSYRDDRHNLRGLFGWERAALEAHFPAAGRVLVVGAGGGREVLALSRMGYAAEGFECNPALVDYAARLLARERCAGTVAYVPRDRAPEGGGPYDAGVVGWSAYMLIAGRERRVDFLRQLRPLLGPGAPLLLSFFTRPGDTPRLRAVHRRAARIRRLLRREPAELGDDLAPNFVHRFVEAEVAAELAAAGFRLASFTPEGPGPHDSGWAVGIAE